MVKIQLFKDGDQDKKILFGIRVAIVFAGNFVFELGSLPWSLGDPSWNWGRYLDRWALPFGIRVATLVAWGSILELGSLP